MTLDDIAQDIRTHKGCGSEPCETCRNFVPGEGPADARVVIVGEAPGASEDRTGRPFVGDAGRLLDQLLEAAGLVRDDVFITNVLKARPPGNRDPKAPEVAHHRPWLEAQRDARRRAPLPAVSPGRGAAQPAPARDARRGRRCAGGAAAADQLMTTRHRGR